MIRLGILFFASIVSVTLVHAVPLGGECRLNSECDGGNRLVCRGGRCKCNEPWARPCNLTCEWNSAIAYAGDTCYVREHCISNTTMNCVDERCQCLPEFTPFRGICLKRLNETCISDSECWSEFCFNSRCQCRIGFDANNDNIDCHIRLVKIYNSWAEANGTNQTCVSNLSCMDVLAECINETSFPDRRYCKCPEGYRASSKNERCEPEESSLLSPLEGFSSVYPRCGFCRDDNAACMKADNQTTCWCRAGYGKAGDRCENNRRSTPLLLFPNESDQKEHDYTRNCSGGINETRGVDNELCSCAPRYRFIARDQPCEKIPNTEWLNIFFEYGVCTRVNSLDRTEAEIGLCPDPLRCEGRQDKHICSCGRGQFRDLNDPSQCVNFIGAPASSGDLRCPTVNARRNVTANVCECDEGFQAMNLGRECRVLLSSSTETACENRPSLNFICSNRFGVAATYCRPGVCRCFGSQYFVNENGTRCSALLDEPLPSGCDNRDCPFNANCLNNRCSCARGFRPDSSQKRCDRINAALVLFMMQANAIDPTFNDQDCQALFTGPVQYLSDGTCQCILGATINDNRTGCWYPLDVPITNLRDTESCPPRSTIDLQGRCFCDIGYRTEAGQCIPKANRVYVLNDPSAVTIADLTDRDCIRLFDTGAIMHIMGRYCTCRSDAFPIDSFTYCRFFIGRYTEEIKGERTCPDFAIPNAQGSTSACLCLPGYRASQDARFCELLNINLIGTEENRLAGNCRNITDNDCRGRFGINAFCLNESCYCDRRASFINATEKCESFSNFVYPGSHELNFHSCEINEDCGDRAGVICDFLVPNRKYKVCQCRFGWLLDPRSQICVEQRCRPTCDVNRNFECRGYQCVCKQGFQFNGTDCVSALAQIELGEVCNRTEILPFGFNGTYRSNIICDQPCGHYRCSSGFRVDGARCVPYELRQDRCVGRNNICSQIDVNAVCYLKENSCACASGSYRSEENCARPVNARCSHDVECGSGAFCKGGRCRCRPRYRVQNILDLYRRSIDRCVSGGSHQSVPFMLYLMSLLIWFIPIR